MISQNAHTWRDQASKLVISNSNCDYYKSTCANITVPLFLLVTDKRKINFHASAHAHRVYMQKTVKSTLSFSVGQWIWTLNYKQHYTLRLWTDNHWNSTLNGGKILNQISLNGGSNVI